MSCFTKKRQRSEKKPECLRCGRCCILSDGRPCDYMIMYLTAPRSYCMIYPRRIGAILRTGQICAKRSELKKNFEECPYNE